MLEEYKYLAENGYAGPFRDVSQYSLDCDSFSSKSGFFSKKPGKY
jgi:hypothetical protein